MRFILPVLCALFLAGAFVAAPLEPAAAQTQIKKKPISDRAMRARAQAGGQIACTPAGCNRVPRGCTPVTGYDFWGNPTGFDAISCRR